MTRNKIGDMDTVQSILLDLYVEVMGDDDDMNDGSCSSLSETSSLGNKRVLAASNAPPPPIPTRHKAHSSSFSSHDDSDFESHTDEPVNKRTHSVPSTSSDLQSDEERTKTIKADITHSLTASFEELFDRAPHEREKTRKGLVQPMEMLLGRRESSTKADDDNEFSIVRAESEDEIEKDNFKDNIVKSSPERFPDEQPRHSQFNFSSTPQRPQLNTSLPPLDENDVPLSPISESSESTSYPVPFNPFENGTPAKTSSPRSPPNPFDDTPDSGTPVIKSARRRSEPHPTADELAVKELPKSDLRRAESRKESTIEEAFAAARLQQQQHHENGTVTDSSAAFIRKNSLVPSRISRRSSRAGGAMNHRKTVATPEFVQKSSLPNIRLKATNVRKKKMSLHRVEQSSVAGSFAEWPASRSEL